MNKIFVSMTKCTNIFSEHFPIFTFCDCLYFIVFIVLSFNIDTTSAEGLLDMRSFELGQCLPVASLSRNKFVWFKPIRIAFNSRLLVSKDCVQSKNMKIWRNYHYLKKDVEEKQTNAVSGKETKREMQNECKSWPQRKNNILVKQIQDIRPKSDGNKSPK